MANDEKEDEVRLRVTQIYTAFYGNQVDSIEAACESVGISRGTFYNWSKKDFPQLVEEIRSQIIQDILGRQNERREYLDRAKLDAEADLQKKAYAAVAEGLDIMVDVMRTAKSGFVRKAAFDAILDAGRNGLSPNNSKIIINNGKDDEAPKQLPATRPFMPLPPPGSVGPATDVHLARERVERQFQDGTAQVVDTKFPTIVEQESPSS